MPIKSFAKAAGFGYKTSVLFENKKIDVSYTASPTLIVNYLQKIFNLAPWQVKFYLYDGCNKLQCAALVGNIYDNKEAIIKLMKAYGWDYCMMTDEIEIDNQHWVMLHFGPLFQSAINSEIKHNDMLYHFSPFYNYESIMKLGLLPKAENSVFSYSPRIYLLKPNISKSDLNVIGSELNFANKNIKNDGHYILFNVDIAKISYDIDIFYDPRYEQGYYTKQPINKESLSKKDDYFF